MYNNNRKLGSLKTYDPRVKLYIMCMYLIMCIVSWKVIPVTITCLSGIIIVLLSGQKLKYLWDISVSAILIELLIALILLFVLKPLMVLFLILKVIMLTCVYNSVIRCFKQVELLDGLTTGFELGAAMSKRIYTILQFYPRLERQKKRVRNALKARGVDPDGGNILVRFKTELMLSIPNNRNTFVESINRETAMGMRDYTSTKRRKRVYEIKMNLVDEVALIIGIIFVLIVIYLQIR